MLIPNSRFKLTNKQLSVFLVDVEVPESKDWIFFTEINPESPKFVAF